MDVYTFLYLLVDLQHGNMNSNDLSYNCKDESDVQLTPTQLTPVQLTRWVGARASISICIMPTTSYRPTGLQATPQSTDQKLLAWPVLALAYKLKLRLSSPSAL